MPLLHLSDVANRGPPLCRNRSSSWIGLGQILDDWAVRPIVALAVSHEMLESLRHGLEVGDPALEFRNVLKRDGLYIRACAAAVTPQRQQLRDLFNRETQVPGTADEAQSMHVWRAVTAVPGLRADGLRNETSLLVIPDHFGRNP